MTALACGILLMSARGALAGGEESAAAIMAKVAANQERAQEMRRAFVYRQSVLIRFHRGNHRLAREEDREYTVAPTPAGVDKKLVRFSGKYERKGKTFAYDKPHYTYKDVDIDGEVISDLAEDLTSEAKSRDGIASDLFPLTGEQQAKYTFRLAGREKYGEREVYRVFFQPVRKQEDGSPWAGEALIDAKAYQPVLVTTRLARGIPFLVKTLLGTDLKYLGFKVTYQEFDNGVWFPVTYGGEFDLSAVFFYKRRISLSLVNSGFERAHVTSDVTFLSP